MIFYFERFYSPSHSFFLWKVNWWKFTNRIQNLNPNIKMLLFGSLYLNINNPNILFPIPLLLSFKKHRAGVMIPLVVAVRHDLHYFWQKSIHSILSLESIDHWCDLIEMSFFVSSRKRKKLLLLSMIGLFYHSTLQIYQMFY